MEEKILTAQDLRDAAKKIHSGEYDAVDDRKMVVLSADVLFDVIYRLENDIQECKFKNERLKISRKKSDEKAAELQKQVDELTERCEIAEGTKRRLTIFDRIAIHDKAVKDTAKEILTLLQNGINLNGMIDGEAKIAVMNELRWAGRRYGVEVKDDV